MKPLRPQLRGLVFKLALFYVLLSLPSLVLVEFGVLLFEFKSFTAAVEGGSLTSAAARAADDLARVWPSAAADEAVGLGTWTEDWVLRLQRPRGGLLQDESYILVELSADPIAMSVLAPDGHLLARAPHTHEKLDLPGTDSADWRAAQQGSTVTIAADPASSDFVRSVLTPVHGADGSLRGMLLVELRVPVPWHRFLSDLSLEWPIVLGYLIVFGIASSIFLATWVTRRLNHIARAANAWSGGDFSDRIGDMSRDELGRVSALLDDMALQLKDLLRSRARLATLAERQRLARDLHDTVKQKAFAMSLQLATARRQLGEHAASERVAQAEKLSQQIQQELAQMLDELRAGDSGMTFVERLRTRAQEWAQVSGLELELDFSEWPPLSDESEETLLRIADEALANVLRHSGASRVSVSLSSEHDTLRLAIVDNGRGAGDETRPGMGLGNMRERAMSLAGGRFEFASGADHGTRVAVVFNGSSDR